MKRQRALGQLIVDYDFVPRGKRQVDIELFLYRKSKLMLEKLKKHLIKHGGIKFQLRLNVLLGKYKLDVERYFEIKPWFQSYMIQVLTFRGMKDKLDQAKRIILAFFDGFVQMGSGWFLNEILLLRISIYMCNPFGGCASTHLPISKRTLLSVQCKDNKCFMYSVLAAYKKCPNATRPGKYSDLISIFNWSGISFPTKLSEIPIF